MREMSIRRGGTSARFVGADRWMRLSHEITLIGRCRERRETVFYATSSVHAVVKQRKRPRGAEGRDLMDETESGAESMDGTRKSVYAAVPLGRIEVLPFATVTPASPCIDSSFKLGISGRERASERASARERAYIIKRVTRLKRFRGFETSDCVRRPAGFYRGRATYKGDSITRCKNIPLSIHAPGAFNTLLLSAFLVFAT